MVDPLDSRYIRLVANYCDKLAHEFDEVAIPIWSRPGKGLTGYIAAEFHHRRQSVIHLCGEELRRHEYNAGRPFPHLIESSFSSLAVPFTQGRHRLSGMLKFQNKKGRDGRAADAYRFTKVDIGLARLIAGIASVFFESLTRMAEPEMIVDLLGEAHSAGNERKLDDALQRILEVGKVVLNVHRGDIVWKKPDGDGFGVRAQCGPTNSEYAKGKEIPTDLPSVIGTVATEKTLANISNVKERRDYLSVCDDMLSELAAPITLDGKVWGVINFESTEAGAFDELDSQRMRVLAKYAASTVASVDRQTTLAEEHESLRSTVKRWEQPGETDPETVLPQVLEAVRDSFGFEAGLIWIADHAYRLLRCEGSIGCDDSGVDSKKLVYGFNEKPCLAAEVWRTGRAYWSKNVSGDAIANNDIALKLQIGPAVAIPIRFRDEQLGVLVAWSRDPKNYAVKGDELRFKHFAEIAGAAIKSLSAKGRNKAVLEKIARMIDSMQHEGYLEEMQKWVLEAVLEDGFDKVRYFHYDAGSRRFVGATSLGMEDPRAFEGRVT